MVTTIYDVLEQLRASAISESDKGAKFERLMKAYLRIDPVFADQFSDVWLWSEYPERAGQARHRHRPGRAGQGHRALRRHPVQVLRADAPASPSR